MRLFLTLILCFFCRAVVAQKQRTIDSLLTEIKRTKTDSIRVKNLNLLAVSYLKVDSTKGFQYSRKALQISKKINWKEGIASSNFSIGAHYGENLSKVLPFHVDILVTTNFVFAEMTYYLI